MPVRFVKPGSWERDEVPGKTGKMDGAELKRS
jgi:hypothetical protein